MLGFGLLRSGFPASRGRGLAYAHDRWIVNDQECEMNGKDEATVNAQTAGDPACPACVSTYSRSLIDPATGHRYAATRPHPFTPNPFTTPDPRPGRCYLCNGGRAYIVHETAR